MVAILNQLSDLDHQILQIIEKDEVGAEEILGLVDIREQLVGTIIETVKLHPALAKSAEWQETVKRTQYVVATMQTQTEQLGQRLRQYRHGTRSLAQYKKFI